MALTEEEKGKKIEDLMKHVEEMHQAKSERIYKRVRAGERTKELYREYLWTEEWRKITVAVHKRDGGACVLCGCTYPIPIHHYHYNNVYYEKLEDLVTLCDAHHRWIHETMHDKFNWQEIKAFVEEYKGRFKNPDEISKEMKRTGKKKVSLLKEDS